MRNSTDDAQSHCSLHQNADDTGDGRTLQTRRREREAGEGAQYFSSRTKFATVEKMPATGFEGGTTISRATAVSQTYAATTAVAAAPPYE